MDSLLEKQRRSHEAIDRLENLAASLLMDVPRSYRERLTQQRRVADLAKMVADTATTLSATYEDENGARAAELEKISGPGALGEFYTRLDSLVEYHQRNPGEEVEPMELEFMNPDAAADDTRLLDTVFSGEEHYGHFVDLHEQYKVFVNLKDATKCSYVAYLETLTQFDQFPVPSKNAEYKDYVTSVYEYLRGFIERAQPMFDLDVYENTSFEQFNAAWSAGTLAQWAHFIQGQAPEALYCDACQKQFLKQHVFDRHRNEKRHIKAAAALAATPRSDAEMQALRAEKRAEFEDQYRDLACLEFMTHALAKHLAPVITATRDHLERKQTLTETELLEELAAMADPDWSPGLGDGGAAAINNVYSGVADHAGDSDDEGGKGKNKRGGGGGGDADSDDEDDDDEKVYNPLKLPMGWDGKPIPYWLYKLHGLGVEYPCEICGDYVYMGRKAFERHFQEWRHGQGMKALGIPNSKHFQDIVKIADALSLWEKLRQSQQKTNFRADVDEEFEDSEGNVMSRQMYEDLARQGLL
ncbi:Pre-mRNA-splicing factor sap61 [Blastocladiella emersonii ATCC 22665]|nr:Pre-mRNA-splicing factor sap61 [Blastocladiella emersonii ATCC 22665]